MLEQWELDAARADVQDVMPDSCQLQTAALTNDGQLGRNASWSTVATVACRLVEIKPGVRIGYEKLVGSRFEATLLWKLILPYGTVVGEGQRAIVSGRTFMVISVPQAMSDRLTVVAIVAEQDAQ